MPNNYEMKIVFLFNYKSYFRVIEVTLDDQGELGIQKIHQNIRYFNVEIFKF